MSVRAYKIVKPAKLSNASSFNLWHDTEVLEFLENAGADLWSRASGDGGTIELSREHVEKALTAAKEAEKRNSETENAEKDRQNVETLEDILADFKKGDDYVRYECY